MPTSKCYSRSLYVVFSSLGFSVGPIYNNLILVNVNHFWVKLNNVPCTLR